MPRRGRPLWCGVSAAQHVVVAIQALSVATSVPGGPSAAAAAGTTALQRSPSQPVATRPADDPTTTTTWGAGRSVAGAFSAEECRRIEALFDASCEPETDVRPSMGIARRNYWLRPVPRDDFGWVVARVLESLGRDAAFWETGAEGPRAAGSPPKEVLSEADFFDEGSGRIDFVLMHEFARDANFFDWHVDTKPGDGTRRTVNVNVILSTGFSGGELELGGRNASLGLGDLHAYPAALPHKVHDVLDGVRRTLVVAVRLPGDDSSDEEEESRGAYFENAERAYAELCRRTSDDDDHTVMTAPPAKMHWIYGDFLQATGRADEARLKYADSYRSTPERDAYVDAFAAAAAEKHAAGDLAGAADDLHMCAAIRPELPDHYADLGVVLWQGGDLEGAERALRAAQTAAEARGATEGLVAATAALTVVLEALGDSRRLDALAERDRAMSIDRDLAASAFDQLRALQ